jgi:3-methyladenine DNA glycosylase Mpg
VSLDLDGADLVDGDEIWIEPGVRTGAVGAGPRVGVHEVTRSWRYWIEGDPFVSRGRPGPPTPKATVRAPRARSTTP